MTQKDFENLKFEDLISNNPHKRKRKFGWIYRDYKIDITKIGVGGLIDDNPLPFFEKQT